jgi:signal transduction histidine kinase
VARYYANTFIRSKIGSKITIFLFILIILVITNFVIVSYYQSQMTYLGNSINIAGKNRFLTSNLMLHVSEYLLTEDKTKSSSEIKSAINRLESNILTLQQGGTIGAGIDLKPLPREFLDDWNKIYQKWISIKTDLADKIIKSTNSETTIDSVKEASLLETEAVSLINSSNLLVTKLSHYLKSNLEYSLFIQQIFTILIILVTGAFTFYLGKEILKPILSLTSTISEVNGEKLNVTRTQNRGNHNNHNNKKNELSVLSDSFNHMVNSMKNIKKKDELIKKLEKANEELKSKDLVKDEFINVAAHEMKNPIQSILAFSELLRKRDINLEEKNEEFLAIIIKNSKRLQHLAEEVLDIGRIECGSFSLNKEKFDLKDLLIDILKEYEQIIQYKKNLKLIYESSEIKEIIIEADRNRLCQVIQNLLKNAIRFTNEGSITVIVQRKENQILVSIKDTGTGIHPEVLPKLFTKFATKTLTGGTGLGLFISKSIIEMHGGRIWATNNKEGVGATITFTLPIKNNHY